MDIEQLQSWYEMAWPMVSGLLLGLLILVAGWIAAKWAQRLALGSTERANLDKALGRFFASIARYTVLAATLIAALGAVGVETTSLLTVFASAGLAIGLAMQGSLSNFAAGVMLLFFRYFDLGDYVEVSGESGTVKDIGLFATRLLTPANETIIVPNGEIIGNNITNFTREGTRRAAIDVGVEYDTKVQEVLEALERAAAKAKFALDEPAPKAVLVGFGASSVDYKVLVWCKAENYVPVQHQVKVAVYEELERVGIGMPYQQVVLHRTWGEAEAEAAAK